jgi:Succinate dehydrogenase/fumarate reductase, flavoprotein subunit
MKKTIRTKFITLLRILKNMNNDNILIIGGGNAGLCAAITAARKGQKVTIIERGDEYSRGGNTKYTRDIRYVHDEDDATTGPYSEEEFLKDLLDVTSGNTNFELAREVIKESRYVKNLWMKME